MKKLPINRYIDHAVLKPELSQDEAIKAIQLGIDYHVKTVCVRPCDIQMAVALCQGTQTEVCAVVGFPHGVIPSEIKAIETEKYIEYGAKEIDMVVNYGYIKSGQWDKVAQDIALVAQITQASSIPLKVIFETSMLNMGEIEKATALAITTGASFVKTSTGFHGGGATEEAVAAMLRVAQGRIHVKASGGIRDSLTAWKYVYMGCERLGIGYSSVPDICNGLESSDIKNDAY